MKNLEVYSDNRMEGDNMAMIDYGVIAKKNGKLITTGLFTPMKDTLGFEYEKDNNGNAIDGNYFAFLGDKDFYIGIYKTYISIFNKNNLIKNYVGLPEAECLNIYKDKNITELIIKRFDNNNRYLLRFLYKCDLYEAVYGYDVDIDVNSWYDLKDKDRIKLEEWVNIR